MTSNNKTYPRQMIDSRRKRALHQVPSGTHLSALDKFKVKGTKQRNREVLIARKLRLRKRTLRSLSKGIQLISSSLARLSRMICRLRSLSKRCSRVKERSSSKGSLRWVALRPTRKPLSSSVSCLRCRSALPLVPYRISLANSSRIPCCKVAITWSCKILACLSSHQRRVY